MALKLITPPAVEPLTAAEAEERLGLPLSTSDTLLNSLIKAARQYVELIIGRALINQTWDLLYDEFPTDGAIQIPLLPLLEVESVNYIDPTTALEVVIDTDDYQVDLVGGWVVPVASVSWPAPMDAINTVRIRFRAGYGALGSDVPEPIRQAIAMQVGSLRASASRSDPTLQSETVEGIGSKRWDTSGGSSSSSGFVSVTDILLSPYRTIFL